MNYGGSIQVLPERRNTITAPIIADALPPDGNHVALSFEASVKARYTSELTGPDALKP
jgi:hypothetical protein